MAGAIYKAEFTVIEQPSANNVHKELSQTPKGGQPSAVAGNGQSLSAVAKKVLPKLSVAVAIQAAIKIGQFAYDTVTTQKANSAMISGDTVAYKQLQNQKIVTDKVIGMGSSLAAAVSAGFLAGSIVPGIGNAVGAAVATGVWAVQQGMQAIQRSVEWQEEKRVFQEKARVEQTVNNLDRERFGSNAKTFR